MPFDSGLQNPDGSYTFTGARGESLTTAPTPAAADFFATLARRQEQSAPLAMGAPPADMSGGSGGAPGAIATGSYDRPINPPVVSDVGPSMSDQGAQGASSGYSAPPAVAPVPEVKAPATKSPASVDPSSVSFVEPGAAGAGDGAGGGRQDQWLNVGERARQEQMDEEIRKGNGRPVFVKGGITQTGQATKTKTEGGKDAERIGAMSDQLRTQAFAGQNVAQAQTEYEADVDARMGLARLEQRLLDDAHQEKKQTALRGIHEKREALDAQIAETKIDPQAFWADKTAGDKIAFVLAAAITGAFNGYAGKQGNQVLDVVNKRIDENINAQIRNLDSKKTRSGELGRIYQQAKEQWGDETVARNVAKAAALTAAEKTVRQQASESKSELVQAQAGKLSADLAAQIEKLWFDNAGTITTEMDKKYNVTQDRMVGGAKTDWAKVEAIATRGRKENDPGATKGPQTSVWGGETYHLGGVAEAEAAKVRAGHASLQGTREDIAELVKLRESSATERLFPSALQTSLHNRIAAGLSKAQDMGVLQGNEREEMQKIMGNFRAGDDAIKSMDSYVFKAGRRLATQAGGVPIGKVK